MASDFTFLQAVLTDLRTPFFTRRMHAHHIKATALAA